MRLVVDTRTGNTYDKYTTANPAERLLVGRFLTRLDDALPPVPPRRVLEVGAGEGEVATRITRRHPDALVTVLDLPDPALAGEWTGRRLTGVQGDAGQLPFPDDTFDLVLGIEVLEHVTDPELALAELARVASGDVVLSVPREPVWRLANMARGKYWGAWGNTPGHLQHWSSRSFTRLVARHLDVVSVRQPFPWTLVRARATGPGRALAASTTSSPTSDPGDARHG